MVRPLVRHLTPSFIIRSSGPSGGVGGGIRRCTLSHRRVIFFCFLLIFFLKKASNSRRTRKRQSTKTRYNPVASHTIQGKYPPRMKIQEKRAEPAPPSTVHTKSQRKNGQQMERKIEKDDDDYMYSFWGVVWNKHVQFQNFELFQIDFQY